MIDWLSIRNFKALKNVDLPLAPLTVFAGLNGSGKSTALQALVLVQRNLIATREPAVVRLNPADLKIGAKRDACYVDAQSDAEGLSISVGNLSEGDRIGFRAFGNQADADSAVELPSVPAHPVQDGHPSDSFIQCVKGIQYISADRWGAVSEHPYHPEAASDSHWGAKAENAVSILHDRGEGAVEGFPVLSGLRHESESNESLLSQVNAWMKEISPGTYVQTEPLSRMKVGLNYYFGLGVNKHLFQAENVGFGISAVLPVVAMVLSARPGDCLLIESPEAHLHPRGQAEVGRLFARAAMNGVQVLVETHSDHVVNGIRVAVKQHRGVLSGKAKILFFERKPQPIRPDGVIEQYSTFQDITIEDDGELSRYPDGLLSEWADLLSRLL